MKRAARPPRVAILGCGNVGRAFVRGLLGIGLAPEHSTYRGPLTIWSRSRTSVRRCQGELRARDARLGQRLLVAASLAEAVQGADVVLLSVAETALPDVVRDLKRALSGRRARPVLLLASGFQALADLRRALGPGLSLGRFHPLAPVPEGSVGLRYASFGIEGDAKALRAARRLLRHLDGQEVVLRPGQAARYHAGAALLGGGLVALWALTQAVMRPTVRQREALDRALYTFAGRNVVHAWSHGAAQALTGPLARGSAPTVRLHLRALRAVPEARAAYCLLGRTMLALARARGSIDAATERRLRRLLKGPKGRR